MCVLNKRELASLAVYVYLENSWPQRGSCLKTASIQDFGRIEINSYKNKIYDDWQAVDVVTWLDSLKIWNVTQDNIIWNNRPQNANRIPLSPPLYLEPYKIN